MLIGFSKYQPDDKHDHIPMWRWGEDHWSTLAYIETVAVDDSGKVKNSRMRCNARLHRNMYFGSIRNAGVTPPTRLKDGELADHDDWSCVEDMAAAGLVEVFYANSIPYNGVACYVWLTDLGFDIAAQLRKHKARGGRYSDFVPTL